MEYKLKKYSEKDLEILNTIQEELDKIYICKSFSSNPKKGLNHAVKTGTTGQVEARQTLFTKNSKSEVRYPHMMKLFNKFIDCHMPSFKFESVYVNKNTVCKKHIDSKNCSNTLLVGVGNYENGFTILYEDEDGIEFDIKETSLLFNGSKIYHSSTDFSGTRYSLVFFG